jgi:hypothetical protein
MNYTTLTKDDKEDIFDIVNSYYLNLTGRQATITKRLFKDSWKVNKSVGCFELMMKLYEAEDIILKANGLMEAETDKTDIGKPISWKRFMMNVRWRDQRNKELEQQLEDIEEGKGYMNEETHKDLMKTQLEEQQEIIRALGDDVRKYKRGKEDYEDAYNRLKSSSEKMVFYWQDNCGKICPKCNPVE